MINALLGPLVSLTASAFLIWLTYFLGFRGGRRFESEDEFLALIAPYGGATQYLMDASGAGGIALLQDGQLLVAKMVGDKAATRIFSRSAIDSIVSSNASSDTRLSIKIRFKDLGFSALTLETALRTLPTWLDLPQTRGHKS